MTDATLARSARLYADAFVWDTHAGFMADPSADLTQLKTWRDAGVDYLSINVGFDYMPWERTVETIAVFRHWILAHPEDYQLVGCVADVHSARTHGKMAVTFDLEGLDALNGRLEMIEFYHALGVRQMLFAYNRNNLLGGGCHDDDVGLTDFGLQAIDEMNRLGIFVDVTHCSHRTSLEAIAYSKKPVIFSHSNPRALCDHPRNIRDDQIAACAASGGVIGAVGVNMFMGNEDDVSAERFADHVEYLIERAGPAHVGLGLDYAFPVECDWIDEIISGNPNIWPAEHYTRSISYTPPCALVDLTGVLLERGRSEAVVRGVLGENFLRVAGEVWS